MSDILIVDDERDIRELISDILKDEGYTTRLAGSSEDCMAELNAEPPGLMILDIWLKDSAMDGIDILKHVKRDNPEIPVVIISGHGNIEIAVAAIKQGAYDFIEKPFNIDQLMVVITRAMETSRLRAENNQLKRGEVAEVAARYIHGNSNRANAAFVTVNCATVEPERMEEVLFGRESGERGVEPGLLEQAHGGVIFFDEVADMPLGTQSKILRVLVEQSFQRVGGNDKVRVDLRVISSTNRDLNEEIKAGRFREELYHRLNVVPIHVPGLEDRREDIPSLADFFIDSFNKVQGLPLRKLTEDAAALLQTMPWPGNIRQLKNIVERVLILGPGNGEIQPKELPNAEGGETEGDGLSIGGTIATLPLREARELFEREYLMTQINRFGGNISRTAAFVGMERSALHRKLKSLGVVTSNRAGARVAEVQEDFEISDAG